MKKINLFADMKEANFSKKTLFFLFVLIIFSALIYSRSLHADFLNYDDTDNVVNNVSIHNLSVKNITGYFSTVNLYMYTPITDISYAIDYKLHGLDPFYFKLTNLLIHLLNIVLIYILSFQLFKKNYLSFFLALLFALHPANTDTVSWISARSNLLATMFFILSAIFYNIYLKQNKYLLLTLSFISFVFSLLSKSSGIMLPLTLLLFDYYYQRKFSIKLLTEKIPFLLASCAIGILTVYFRTDSGNTQLPVDYLFFDRIFLTCYSLVSFSIKSVIPFHLSEVYAYPVKLHWFLPICYYLSPILILGYIYLIKKMKVLKREIIFGSLFFLINIIITQFALLEDGFLANRYTYLPYFGLFFVVAKCFDFYSTKFPSYKIYLFSIITIGLILFSAFTYYRSLHWKNTLILFNRVIQTEPKAAFAYNSRGIARYMNSNLDGALTDYNYAIGLNPKYSGAFYNRGLVYNSMQKFESSASDYTKAIELNPNYASAYLARGILEMDVLKNDSLALLDYNNAIKINPSFAQAYYNRGILFMRMNNVSEACTDFHEVQNLGYPNADKLIEHYCN